MAVRARCVCARLHERCHCRLCMWTEVLPPRRRRFGAAVGLAGVQHFCSHNFVVACARRSRAVLLLLPLLALLYLCEIMLPEGARNANRVCRVLLSCCACPRVALAAISRILARRPDLSAPCALAVLLGLLPTCDCARLCCLQFQDTRDKSTPIFTERKEHLLKVTLDVKGQCTCMTDALVNELQPGEVRVCVSVYLCMCVRATRCLRVCRVRRVWPHV